MYLPSHFEENRKEILIEMITRYPLGCLIVQSNGELDANHLPFEFDVQNNKLLAHIAKLNPLSTILMQDTEVLVVFNIDNSYVSPNWYEGKFEHHRVVPTWNYAVIHVKGKASVVQDSKVLRGILARLTREHESTQSTPWKMSDAPKDYIDQQLEHIVAIEVDISNIIGKFKLSQNRNQADILSVANALLKQGNNQLSELMMENLKTESPILKP